MPPLTGDDLMMVMMRRRPISVSCVLSVRSLCGWFWAAVKKHPVAAFNFAGFAVGVTKSRRCSSSISLISSRTYESWFFVSLTSAGFYPTPALHAGYVVSACQRPRGELGRRAWGCSVIIVASRSRNYFLFLPTFFFLDQSRWSADGMGFGNSIAPGSPSVSSCHFEANE